MVAHGGAGRGNTWDEHITAGAPKVAAVLADIAEETQRCEHFLDSMGSADEFALYFREARRDTTKVVKDGPAGNLPKDTWRSGRNGN